MNVNWSRIIGNIGRTLIGTGTIILLFVVYQLWGTAIHEQRAQSDLRSNFQTALEGTGVEVDQLALDAIALPATLDERAFIPAASVEGSSETDQPSQAAEAAVIDASYLPEGLISAEHGPPPPPAEDGDAVAEIRIPRIGLTKTVVEGVTTEQLKKGPGHYPGTPLPGQAGNASIAGHRTTYGAPFGEIDELEINDLIYVTTLQGSFVYRVIDQLIVSPKDVWVLDPSNDNHLTLTTCHPKYSARERLVVVAELIGEPAESDQAQLAAPGELELPSENLAGRNDDPSITTTAPDATSTTTTAVTIETADGEEVALVPVVPAPTTTTVARAPIATEISHGGIDGIQSSRVPAMLWGLFAAFVAFAIWYAAERWRKWVMYAAGAPIFLIVLFLFFEAFSALLPPGV